MFTKYVCIDTIWRNLGLLSENTSQSCRVETRSGAQDMGLWQSGQPPREVG